VTANAEGEASRFRQIVTEYNRAPAVTRERMYLETIQQILSSTSTIIVDQKSSGNLLFLPLDKLLQMPGAASTTPLPESGERVPQAEVQPPVAPSTDTRSRESFRTRDREPRP
jgi:membrane protease subunit HflK